MMQQHIALERFGTAVNQSPRGSAVLRALKKWGHAESVVAFGHLPEPWIPQLVSLAMAEGEVALMQDIFLRRLAWRHADQHIADATVYAVRITVLVECIINGVMPDALPLLADEVEAASQYFGDWIDATLDIEEIEQGHMAQGRMEYVQYLLWTLCSVLTYRGQYEYAQAVMAMRILPWEPEDASNSDTMRAAWGRETLVVVQLARQQYEGAVEALLAAPCWAQVAAVGRRLAKALGFARQRRLQHRVMDYLAAGQQQQPGALEEWKRTLEQQGRHTMMAWGLLSGAELGVCTGSSSSGDNGNPTASRHADRKAATAQEQLAQHMFDYVQLLAAGRQAEAVASLMDASVDAGSLYEAANHVHTHLLLSLGLHHYSVPTPQQQQAVQGLVRALWSATQRDPARVGRSGRAHVLLSYLAWQSLNAGRLGDALAVADPPVQLQTSGQWAKKVVRLLPTGPGAAAATLPPATSMGSWQWGAAAPAAPRHSVLLPNAGGLVEHSSALLGLNLDLSRGTCGLLATRWCRQEMSLQAAAAVPGRPPAYVLQPGALAALRRLLDAPAYSWLRSTCLRQASAKPVAPPDCDEALSSFERMYALNDLLAISLAAATAQDPSPALELDAACVSLQQLLHMDSDPLVFARYTSDTSLTRAALLAAYGRTHVAAQLAQQTCARVGDDALGSGLALDVVRCVKHALTLVDNDVTAWVPTAGGQARSGPVAAAPPRPAEEQECGTAAEPFSTAASAVSSLVAALPVAGAVWATPGDAAIACVEAVHLLLLQRRYGPSDQAAAQQLLQRVLRPGQLAADPPRWTPGHMYAVPRLLGLFEELPSGAREEAFDRMAQVLRGVLLPHWPLGLAVLMGGALENAPEWTLAEPLHVAWRCWDEPGGDEVRRWEAFAGAFRRFFGDEDPVQLLSAVSMQRLMLVLRAAPAAAWGPLCEATATEVGLGQGSRGEASPQLEWLLQCLAASWAEEPHDRVAVEGRAWCVSFVREACGRGARYGRSVAALMARQAREAGLEGLAEAVMAEVLRAL